jgi:hypothetical protein
MISWERGRVLAQRLTYNPYVRVDNFIEVEDAAGEVAEQI